MHQNAVFITPHFSMNFFLIFYTKSENILDSLCTLHSWWAHLQLKQIDFISYRALKTVVFHLAHDFQLSIEYHWKIHNQLILLCVTWKLLRNFFNFNYASTKHNFVTLNFLFFCNQIINVFYFISSIEWWLPAGVDYEQSSQQCPDNEKRRATNRPISAT